MFTIEKAMKLPAMKGTKLIAGERGKNRPVKWVTTIEIIEDISRFHEGELVVTTGYGLADHPAYATTLIALIESGKLSGIAFYSGFYINNVPEEIVNAAEEQGLPLIEIPSTINFSTITKAIVEQIGNEQMNYLEDSLAIHKEMTKWALNNGGLKEALQKISLLTDASLFVFDDLGDLQAFENIHSDKITVIGKKLIVDNVEQDMALFFTNAGNSGVYQQSSFRLFPSKIESGSFTYGYLLAAKEKKAWKEMNEMIMDHAATLVGIQLVKQYAVEETKVSLQGELVEEILLKEKVDEAKAVKRGKRLGFDLTKTHAVLLFQIINDDNDPEKNSQWSNHLHYVVAQTLSKQQRQRILLAKVNTLYALIEADWRKKAAEKRELISIAAAIHERWSRQFPVPLMIGIGNCYAGLDQLSQSAKDSEYAVQYAPLLVKESNIVHIDDLGFYQLLIRMQEAGLSLKDFYESYLGDLLGKKQSRTDLVATAEAYLVHNCNIQRTAASLYIHRHTLKYRLMQIEKRTGLDLQSHDDRMNLHLAILAYKFYRL
ncbi:purine catabolism regulatory protein [Evansella caseinilytica]|uniref:Purine catabolism regulatory protein n=1 Tax=Evansella caseinilytica TaxID=1503961 RepID=A0A1H3NLT5_9BACI|nr:PucR family transcriptional regulator ligand-binding domain-containing protein [Evansella caseinilytica]SDY89774.1 purine catabolism regulatory protein [Evansella caseinilytica]